MSLVNSPITRNSILKLFVYYLSISYPSDISPTPSILVSSYTTILLSLTT